MRIVIAADAASGRPVSTSAGASSSRNRRSTRPRNGTTPMPRPPISSRSTATPAATARLIAKGDNAKIGRVAVMPSHRGTGLGRDLMVHILTHAKDDRLHRVRDRGATHRDPVLRAAGLCRRRSRIRRRLRHPAPRHATRARRLARRRRALRESRSTEAAQPHLRKQGLRPFPRTRAAVDKTRVSGAKPLHLRHFGPHARVCPVDAYLSRS
jgi:GNAT superfamily N-acetyltransferase